MVQGYLVTQIEDVVIVEQLHCPVCKTSLIVHEVLLLPSYQKFLACILVENQSRFGVVRLAQLNVSICWFLQ